MRHTSARRSVRVVLVSLCLTVALTRVAAADDVEPVRIGDEETIVFYGDSITEQNLYAAYLETFLLTRFPQKRLAIFNFGWGGDTAGGGHRRFSRDVAGVEPSLVFVNFGMNDGGYQAFDPAVLRVYMDGQAALADDIAALGAREVLFTTSPVDDAVRGDDGIYNDTLARLAEGVIDLGRTRHIPVIDLFGPMREVQRRAKAADPSFTMIPDAIHPDAVGHLVMAYLAMRRIDAPRTVGEIIVNGTAVDAHGVSMTNVVSADGLVSFDLTLPFLPFYVLPAARGALALVPLQDELNRFRLRGSPGAGATTLLLSVDGRSAGTFTAGDLARGVDLALLDNAPWTTAGRTVWEAARFRWEKHFEAWRRMGIDRPARMMPDLTTFDDHVRTQRAYADELGRSLGRLAQPATYRVVLAAPGMRVPIDTLDVSPMYPLDGFDTAYPPERDPARVRWTRVPVVGHQLDLAAHFRSATNVVSYARLRLECDRSSMLHLALGSDDGLAVFLDGRQVFARDVLRALRQGEDEIALPLDPGRHELLFKVTQAGGGYGLAVEAQVLGGGTVRPLIAR